jgi:predicted transcriptional regulator
MNHSLTIELSDKLYTALRKKAQITCQTETELVIQGLQQILGEKDRFADLEATLEQKLKKYLEKYVENLVADRVSKIDPPSLELPSLAESQSPKSQLTERVMPVPTIRALQVGDRVLILEHDSPYYMAKLLVIKTSLIRATVQTDLGEKTFLKRDLRFVEATVS